MNLSIELVWAPEQKREYGETSRTPDEAGILILDYTEESEEAHAKVVGIARF